MNEYIARATLVIEGDNFEQAVENYMADNDVSTAFEDVTDAKSAHAYDGPFTPPPPGTLEGALGWRFTKRYPEPNRWEPTGWEIIFPDSILTVDMSSGLATRDSIIYAP